MKNNLVTISEKYNSLWITLNEHVTMDNYRSVEMHLTRQITQSHLQYVVLDLSGIKMLFSSGVGLMIRLDGFTKSINKQFYCTNSCTKVMEGFQLLGLDKILSLCATEQDFVHIVNVR